ncbi:putative DNA polymerase kappa [Paratrimastix pyriformis]|uniref:DNA polymerase kappa n=1 Tax=Paratrimastix pyriformis TaxID=342808 RepID=A0ABQ8UKD7_9EUKA|nr:putative DNA polymerase kappa [Paratrimastix pyriformis]
MRAKKDNGHRLRMSRRVDTYFDIYDSPSVRDSLSGRLLKELACVFQVTFWVLVWLVFAIRARADCADDVPLSKMSCDTDFPCIWHAKYLVNCSVPVDVDCTGTRNFTKPYFCRYCYQWPETAHNCTVPSSCNAKAADAYALVQCTVHADTLCIGTHTFPKWVPCRWTSGKSWYVAMITSLFLGGIAADRFYLGYVFLGVLKLISLGGLGIWAVADAVFLAVGYLGPADGSLFADDFLVP